MKIELLDHGYVEFIEAFGTGKDGKGICKHDEYDRDFIYDIEPDYEVGIIEAARQSTQGSFRDWYQDRKLLAYLYEHQHNTPFEFAGMVIEVQAPIFVFREWHRHRVQAFNESSARYAPLPPLYYMPTPSQLEDRGMAATSNKQAGSAASWDHEEAMKWLRDAQDHLKESEELYQRALKSGVPKELARITMPVGHYSRMRASANLRNWLAFLTLRMDPAAQYEIRMYANAVGEIIAKHFPRTWELFNASR
jgi:thymidylate synthase (FAD)